MHQVLMSNLGIKSWHQALASSLGIKPWHQAFVSFLAPKSGDPQSGDPVLGTHLLGTPVLGTSILGTPGFENEDLGRNSQLKAFLRFVSSSSPDYLLQDAASQMLRPRKKDVFGFLGFSKKVKNVCRKGQKSKTSLPIFILVKNIHSHKKSGL